MHQCRSTKIRILSDSRNILGVLSALLRCVSSEYGQLVLQGFKALDICVKEIVCDDGVMPAFAFKEVNI